MLPVEADQREPLLDDAAKHPGYFYADVFRKVSESLAVERWPFPPPGHVTIARIVHLLAMRTVAKSHPSMPAGTELIVPQVERYLAYLDAALTLNDAIDSAAKAGAFRLRDRSTGVPVPDWHLPTWDRRDSLKRAIFEGDHRRAIDYVVSSDWLIAPYPHFAPSLTVLLSEFSAWAEREGIAAPSEVADLLQTAPKDLLSFAGAIKMFSGGPEVDLDAGLYPEPQRAAKATAEVGFPAVAAPDTPQLDALKARVKQKAQETAEAMFDESKQWPKMSSVAKRLERLANEAVKRGEKDGLFYGQKGQHRESWYKARLKGWQPEKIGRPKKK